MEYRVHKDAASQAEITLDIESAGHWFGGGALQHLPAMCCALAPTVDSCASNSAWLFCVIGLHRHP